MTIICHFRHYFVISSVVEESLNWCNACLRYFDFAQYDKQAVISCVFCHSEWNEESWQSVRRGRRTLHRAKRYRGPRKVLQSKLFGERRNKWSNTKGFARKFFLLCNLFGRASTSPSILLSSFFFLLLGEHSEPTMTGIYLLYLIHHLIQPKIVSLFHKKAQFHYWIMILIVI